ncbi:aminotransferase class IV family protein [Gallibacterium salpingitidis]|uniref:aminotransferase class IV family protein n=1 Tax=Gallibacterium salpingitidis TaxID=505341 RepID=UPI0026708B14|nr:aminotransferase class IV family protein [Gallibacterium salpingitidis]WKS99952.1 aminotransferase class IV family protein [Gallibacterium salpingitidis]
MFLCFETLAIQDGEIQNLTYHQARYQRTLQHFYSTHYQAFNFADIVKIPLQYQQGLVRCRIDYNQQDYQIAFYPYQRRQFKRFQPVVCEQLDYRFKYCNREQLNALYQQRQGADEILIIQQGKITDCSIGNLALLRQGEWFTPDSPLLAGTQRQRLLEQQLLQLRSITLNELDLFEEIRVINALNNL